jgi:N-acetylmuramoyl-L-alanine amidase
VILAGWAIHESGIQSIEIFLDREYAVDGNIGVDRPGVASAYPAFQRQMISGWNALIDTTQLSSGPHEIVVKVRAKNGGTRDLAVPVVVANSK